MRPAIVWFRRDLRLHDHPALTAALAEHGAVVALFVVDDLLLGGRWPAPNRISFMLGSARELAAALEARGGRLVVRRGRPVEVVAGLAREIGAGWVHVSRDYAPYGRARDAATARALAGVGAELVSHPGLLIREPEEIHTQAGGRYAVFTPFRRSWERAPLREIVPAPARVPFPAGVSLPGGPGRIPEDAELGAMPTARRELLPEPGEAAARRRLAAWLAPGPLHLDGYARRRDLPGEEGTSRLSADLRWGTLSPLEVLRRSARPGDGPITFASELAWRDFYAHLLWWEPRLVREPFDRRTERLPWSDDPVGVQAWREGRTGYPVVDAAMRQLAATGWMHNRARMIAASFLAKDLLVDWRIGEHHFMEHLVDGDPAANNGGWQWAASTGADAQPWFRIFNPVAQGRRFDPDGAYVRRWVPELRGVPPAFVHEPWRMTTEEQAAAGCRIGDDYPAPIVDHADARVRALAAWDSIRRSPS